MFLCGSSYGADGSTLSLYPSHAEISISGCLINGGISRVVCVVVAVSCRFSGIHGFRLLLSIDAQKLAKTAGKSYVWLIVDGPYIKVY